MVINIPMELKLYQREIMQLQNLISLKVSYYKQVWEDVIKLESEKTTTFYSDYVEKMDKFNKKLQKTMQSIVNDIEELKCRCGIIIQYCNILEM